MNNQIYMFFLRGSDFLKTDKIPVLNIVSIVKNMIRGDSLDVPFVNFIRVQSLSHNISIESGNQAAYKDIKSGVRGGVYENMAVNWKRGSGAENTSFTNAMKRTGSGIRQAFWHKPYGGEDNAWKQTGTGALDQQNAYTGEKQPTPGTVFGHLPEHGTLQFSKWVDAATPQLAFGCSAQEKFPMAAFFFRRRIGVGVGGIRAPYLVIGLRRVMISDWSLNEDKETLKLRYEKICWIGQTGLADTNLAQGLSIRYWERDRNRGGEAGLNWATALATLTAGLTAAAGAPFAAVDAAAKVAGTDY